MMAVDGTWRQDVSSTIDPIVQRPWWSGLRWEGLNSKEFALLLSSTGLIYRRCALEWVNGDSVGACAGTKLPLW